MQRSTNSGWTSVNTPEIVDAGRARAVEQAFDRAEIFDPQRYRRMFEEPARVCLRFRDTAPRAFELGDVFGRHQHAVPALLVTGQHRTLEQHVEAPSAERVVDRVAREVRLSGPELAQLLEVRFQHVVAEHRREVARQRVEIGGLELRERLPIDFDHADAVSAFGNVARVFGEMGAQIGHARGSPFIEQRAHAAEIFEPQRHRREFEHSGVVVDGRGAAREGIQHEVLGIGSAAILDRLAPAENERRLACRFCADVPGE
ncbi:hypothetical protein OKW48_006702 [Paraburkholderia youngii]